MDNTFAQLISEHGTPGISLATHLADAAKLAILADQFDSIDTAYAYIVANAGKGDLYLSPNKIYETNGLILHKNIRIIGSGKTSVIKLKDGADKNVIETYKFADFTGTDTRTIAQSADLPIDFEIRNLTIDGNAANNYLSGTLTANDGYGIRIYGRRYIIDNVFIKNTKGIGFYSELGNPTPSYNVPEDTKTSYIRNLETIETGYEGFVFRGPSDIELGNIIVGLGGKSNATESLLFPTKRVNGMVFDSTGTYYSSTCEMTGLIHVYGFENGCGFVAEGKQGLKINHIISESNAGNYEFNHPDIRAQIDILDSHTCMWGTGENPHFYSKSNVLVINNLLIVKYNEHGNNCVELDCQNTIINALYIYGNNLAGHGLVLKNWRTQVKSLAVDKLRGAAFDGKPSCAVYTTGLASDFAIYGNITYCDRAWYNDATDAQYFDIRILNRFKPTSLLNQLDQFFGISTNSSRVTSINEDNGTVTRTYENGIDPWQTYGYKIDEANTDVETAVTYILESVDKTPATVGDGASESWDATSIYSDIKPCMFKNGVVNYYLSPSDITKKADGITAADITTGADGDVMIEFPTLYWKMNKANAEIYAYLSRTKADPNFKALAHTVGETVKDKIYIGAFPGVIIDGKLRSLSGQIPTASQTIGYFRTAAQTNGAGYQQFGYYQWLMLQHLFYLRFKNRDSQTALGKGYTNLNVEKATGDTNAFPGLYYGTTSDDVSMKCFGIEGLWDYEAIWTDGIFIDANRNILIGNQTVYNNNGEGYTNYGQAAIANLNGYIGTVQGGTETGFIAKTTDGSSTTKYADSGALANSRVASSGGSRATQTFNGISRLYADATTTGTGATIGGRLVYIGT